MGLCERSITPRSSSLGVSPAGRRCLDFDLDNGGKDGGSALHVAGLQSEKWQ